MKILVPTDGSLAALAAEEYAIQLAKKFNASIVALYVAEVAETPAQRLWAKLGKEILKRGESNEMEVLHRIKEQGEKSGITVETVIKHGRPSEEIIKYAGEEETIKMIVMAPRGKGFLHKLFLGNTTLEVIREVGKLVKIPVIITPYTKAPLDK
jgi:nucleotide-binding universal stress UspA family protein